MSEVKMKKCGKCNTKRRNSDSKAFHGSLLYDDCCIEGTLAEMPKALYDNNAEFINRLKDTFSVRKQRYS